MKICCILSKFYIKPQLVRVYVFRGFGCILSKFYIKPQLLLPNTFRTIGCILSKFYIKPQLGRGYDLRGFGCILSKFYIKPQRIAYDGYFIVVVSYRNSTSNHNFDTDKVIVVAVVSYRNSTSNHNLPSNGAPSLRLYLIEILHQTTTLILAIRSHPSLYLIEILHQTTTQGWESGRARGCILSKFYIKPQPRASY